MQAKKEEIELLLNKREEMKILQGQATRDALKHSEEMMNLRLKQELDYENNLNIAKNRGDIAYKN